MLQAGGSQCAILHASALSFYVRLSNVTSSTFLGFVLSGLGLKSHLDEHCGKSRERGFHTSQWRFEPLLTFECLVSLHSAGLLICVIVQSLLVPLCFDALAQDSLPEVVTATKPDISGVVHKLHLLRCLIFPFHPLRPCALANWLQKIKPRGKERQRLY